MATLSWAPPVGTGVAGYRVYYGTASRAYAQSRGFGISTGLTTTFAVSGLQSGQQYYFGVTSVDANGNESDYSNEATKVVQ
jgi:fibronectin type 3 domain-containing protein